MNGHRERHGHAVHAKKSLGQNYLTDEALLEALCADAGVEADDCVLEIGPGMGALTRPLARVAKRVVAVEIDGTLISYLQGVFAGQENVRIVHADILRVDVAKLIGEEFGEGARVRVAANLPYYITSDILRLLLMQRLPMRSLAVMVQKEVGEKMRAQVGEAGWGPLAILCQYRAQVWEARRIPSACFTPRPKVDSSFMRLDLRGEPLVSPKDEALFFKVVRAAFAMRRKTLVNNLQGAFALTREQAVAAVEDAGLDARVRGEALSMQELCAVADVLAQGAQSVESGENAE